MALSSLSSRESGRGLPVYEWFYRSNGAPDMIGFFTTIAVFLFVIYVEGMRVELPISHSQYRGYRGRMPIKLLYVSNIPVILAYALFANFQMVGQFVWSRWNVANDNNWLNWLGTFTYSIKWSASRDWWTCLLYYFTSATPRRHERTHSSSSLCFNCHSFLRDLQHDLA